MKEKFYVALLYCGLKYSETFTLLGQKVKGEMEVILFSSVECLLHCSAVPFKS